MSEQKKTYKEPVLQDILDGLSKSRDLEPGDKMNILCAMIDMDKVMADLNKQAFLIKMGMGEPSPSYLLAYAVVSIMRPDLLPPITDKTD